MSNVTRWKIGSAKTIETAHAVVGFLTIYFGETGDTTFRAEHDKDNPFFPFSLIAINPESSHFKDQFTPMARAYVAARGELLS